MAKHPERATILPPRLRRGEKIGLFCPAGPVRDRTGLNTGIRLIEELGFAVRVEGMVEAGGLYLADEDAGRAASLHRLWDDPEVRAILAIRGGFGCLRLLELLDWQMFAQRPKFLAGFSDVTLLLNTLAQRAGLVAIHGPMAATLGECDVPSLHSLFALLSGAFEERIQPRGLEVLRGGTGRGPLLGGNLASLVHLLATPWDVDWQGAILILEDTSEPLYRLDRMLTQLALAGRIESLAGLVLGEFANSGDSLADIRLHEALWARVLELAGPRYPIWANFPVGHGRRNLALPIGMEAEMDTSAGTLTLLADSVQLS